MGNIFIGPMSKELFVCSSIWLARLWPVPPGLVRGLEPGDEIIARTEAATHNRNEPSNRGWRLEAASQPTSQPARRGPGRLAGLEITISSSSSLSPPPSNESCPSALGSVVVCTYGLPPSFCRGGTLPQSSTSSARVLWAGVPASRGAARLSSNFPACRGCKIICRACCTA